MANDLTHKPLKIDTTDVTGAIKVGRVKGFKFSATGATATVSVTDHVTSAVLYDSRIATSGNSGDFDQVEIETPNAIDVTISNGLLLIYLDDGPWG